jgi:putative redox protein
VDNKRALAISLTYQADAAGIQTIRRTTVASIGFVPVYKMGDDRTKNLPQVIVRGNASGFAQEIQIGSHGLSADEPVSAGGTETGPSPYDLLLAALGSCTSMTISLYARRKSWLLEEVTVLLSHSKIYAADCAECETREGKIDRIEREIKLTGQLTAEQRSKLMEIADKCPVHRTLTSEINIRTKEAA